MSDMHHTSFFLPGLRRESVAALREKLRKNIGVLPNVSQETIFIPRGASSNAFREVMLREIHGSLSQAPPFYVLYAFECASGTSAELILGGRGQALLLPFRALRWRPFARHCLDFLHKAHEVSPRTISRAEREPFFETPKESEKTNPFSPPKPPLGFEGAHGCVVRLPEAWGEEAGNWLFGLLASLSRSGMKEPFCQDKSFAEVFSDFQEHFSPCPPPQFAWPFLALPADFDHRLFEHAVSVCMRRFILHGCEHGFSHILFMDEEDGTSHGYVRIFEHKQGRGLCCVSYDIPILGLDGTLSMSRRLSEDASDMALWEGHAPLRKKLRALSRKISEKNELPRALPPRARK